MKDQDKLLAPQFYKKQQDERIQPMPSYTIVREQNKKMNSMIEFIKLHPSSMSEDQQAIHGKLKRQLLSFYFFKDKC